MVKRVDRLLRAVLVLIFLAGGILGPGLVLSDKSPEWPQPWLQSLVAVVVCVFFLGYALVFSICCISGDISRSEERHARSD